jgi:OOP family OmpA-OmpF porin
LPVRAEKPGRQCQFLLALQQVATYQPFRDKKKGLQHMKAIHWRITTIALVGAMLLIGCAEAPIKVQPIAKTENPTDHVAKLGADLAAAKEEQVNILSPTWFARAEESYKKAKDGLDKGAALSDILDNTARGSAELQQAWKYTDKSKYHLTEAIESRKMAARAGAAKYQKAYASLEKDFLRLTTAVEENDFSYLQKHKKPLSDKYRELELEAIKSAALDNVRHLLEILKDKDDDEIAPKCYADAMSKLAEADAYITENRYDAKGIAQRADTARFYTERLQHIAQTARKIETMTPEDTALWVESFFQQTASRLNEPDRRNNPFEVQQENIVHAVDMLQNSYAASLSQVKMNSAQIDTLQQRIAELEGRSYKEKADTEKLAAEKRFNELYDKVSKYFSDDEAECYKKENQMIIRMKAIRFPVGQSVLMPENYALLTKVQKAIRTFGKPDLIIEGHTDSTGSPAKNQLLSESRAESVRQYLIANKTLPAEKIRAQGFGSSRPLVSNETSEGRAINRRIDIIIVPQMKTE